MRKYRLRISDPASGKALLDFGMSSDNPAGPQIQFNIQQYQASQTVNNTVTIFNTHPYFFSMNQALYGMRVELYAGMEEDPISRKISYSGKYGLILDGWITNVIPEWNGRDTQFTLIVQNYDPLRRKAYLLDVKIGDSILAKILAVYKSLAGTGDSLSYGALPATVLSKTKYQHRVGSMSDLDEVLQSQHGLSLVNTQAGYKISGIVATVAAPALLVEGDFLCQPSLIEQTLTQVAMTLSMRSELKIDDVVNIPKDVFVSVGALDVVRDAVGLNPLFKGKSVFTLFTGSYRIVRVWQLGDVRNPDVQAWATILHGNKI